MINLGVIGGGISGLTTAIVAAELGHSVTLYFISGTLESHDSAQTALLQQFKQTASGAAAAYWSPFAVGDYKRRWIIDSLQRYRALATIVDKQESGIFLGSLRHWFVSEEEAREKIANAYWWTCLPDVWPQGELGVKLASHAEPFYVGDRELTFSMQAITPVIDTTLYFPFLVQRAINLGVTLQPSSQPVVAETITGDHEAVILCGGYASSESLECGDDQQSMAPLFGQLVAADVQHSDLEDDVVVVHTGQASEPLYLVRTVDDSIAWVGGRVLKSCNGTTSRAEAEPIDSESERMLNSAQQVVGSLKHVSTERYASSRAGMRPYRQKVRVEIVKTRQALHGPLVANYGHGGAGYTLSWGCANEAVRLAEEATHEPSVASMKVDLSKIKELPEGV